MGTSGLMAGSYYGPGVPLSLFSGGNFKNHKKEYTLDSKPIFTFGALVFLIKSAS